MSEEEHESITLDFGAGNVVPLPSRCLRVAKEPTDCDICVCICPTGALAGKNLITQEESNEEPKTEGSTSRAKAAIESKRGVTVDSESCIHCGLCVAACPVEALSVTKLFPRAYEKQLKEMSDDGRGLAMSCARSLFGVSHRLASRAVTLPCLASLSAEEWFSAALLARDAVFAITSEQEEGTEPDYTLRVYLPPLICDDCPVNRDGEAVSAYMATITEAEAWGGDNIELVDEAEGLSLTHSGNLMDTLSGVSSEGKRELVEQIAKDFSKSWKSAGEELSREKVRVEQIAKRRKREKKTSQLDLNAPRPFGKKSPRRQLLRSMLDTKTQLAEDVQLVISSTEAHLCKGCGNCVDACPLGARKRISANSVLYFGKLPESKRPQEKMAAVTDQFCCMGCSACVQACPTGACNLSFLNGTDFIKLRLT